MEPTIGTYWLSPAGLLLLSFFLFMFSLFVFHFFFLIFFFFLFSCFFFFCFLGKSLKDLKLLGWEIIDPISKTLACNVKGMGAMAHTKDILDVLHEKIKSVNSEENKKQKIFNLFDTKVLKLKENWRGELGRQKEKENYDLFLAIVFSPCSFCLMIALCIELYDFK